jgi:hypothetical protein
MSQYASLVENYALSVRHPDVSGFEVLDVLRLRSRVADIERELTPAERAALEAGDATFLHNAPTLYRQVCEIATLEAVRREADVPPSHWWWYLDTLTRVPVA